MGSTVNARPAPPRRLSSLLGANETISRLTGVQKWLRWGGAAQTEELNSFDQKLGEADADSQASAPSSVPSPSSPSSSLHSEVEDTRVTLDDRLGPDVTPSSLSVTPLVFASSSTEHLTTPPTSFDTITDSDTARPRSMSSRRSSSASVYSIPSYVGGWVSSMFTPAPPRPKRRPSSGDDDFSSYISLTEIRAD